LKRCEGKIDPKKSELLEPKETVHREARKEKSRNRCPMQKNGNDEKGLG